MASLFEIVNRAHDGKLVDRLRLMRDEGLSIDAITEAFCEDGYVVSTETVRRWCREGGIPTHRVPAPSGTASPAGRADPSYRLDAAEGTSSQGSAGGPLEELAS